MEAGTQCRIWTFHCFCHVYITRVCSLYGNMDTRSVQTKNISWSRNFFLVTLEINKTTAGNLKWDKCDIKQQRAERARFEGSWLSYGADVSWCISSPASEENIFSLNFLLNFVLPELRLQRDQPRSPLLIWAAFRSVCSVHMRVTGYLRRSRRYRTSLHGRTFSSTDVVGWSCGAEGWIQRR